MRVNSIGGSKYFCTFIDSFSRWVEVRFLKTKDQVKREFIKYQTIVENQKEKKIQILRTDNGLEYSGEEFNKHLEKNGILHQKTVPYTPQQNGIAERMNRTLVEMARCMLLESTLPESFWAEAISTAAYIRNRSPTAILSKTPYEVWMNMKPNIMHLKIFGQKVFALNKAPGAGKFSEKSIECIFLGYSAECKAYRLWNIKDTKIIERREVEFINHILPSIIPNQEIAILENPDMDSENLNDSQINESNSLDKAKRPIIENNPEPNITKKSLRHYVERSFNTNEFVAQVACSEITCPSVEEALAGPHADEWTNAMKIEFDSLVKCKTWEKVTRPVDKNIIGCKWVLRTKYNYDGTVEKRKARLVAKGYAQIPGIDYEETFAPVARLGTIRLIISIAAKENLELHQLDVVMAYINGDLNEQIYMEQPTGFVNSDEENLVCLLKKSLYGLKQSGRQWYEKLKNHLTKAGMIQSDYDKCLYYLKSNEGVLFLIVYVDDLIIATNNDSMLSQIKESLNSEFNMKNLGKLNYCLGIQFSQNPIDNTITMSQQKYIDDILTKYKMTNANSVKTPLEPKIQLQKTDSSEEESDKSERNLYQSLIGSLMYLAVCTRPDLAYTVSTLSQFNQNPSQVHWSSAKRVLRYLIATKSYGLTFTNTTESLHGYVDSDWGSNINDRISQYGYIFKLGESSITWESRKQRCVALSSTEAEYVALSEAAKEAVYLKKNLTEIGYMKPEEQIIIYCDNQGAQKLTTNSIYHSRKKHIDIKYHLNKSNASRCFNEKLTYTKS